MQISCFVDHVVDSLIVIFSSLRIHPFRQICFVKFQFTTLFSVSICIQFMCDNVSYITRIATTHNAVYAVESSRIRKSNEKIELLYFFYFIITIKIPKNACPFISYFTHYIILYKFDKFNFKKNSHFHFWNNQLYPIPLSRLKKVFIKLIILDYCLISMTWAEWINSQLLPARAMKTWPAQAEKWIIASTPLFLGCPRVRQHGYSTMETPSVSQDLALSDLPLLAFIAE